MTVMTGRCKESASSEETRTGVGETCLPNQPRRESNPFPNGISLCLGRGTSPSVCQVICRQCSGKVVLTGSGAVHNSRVPGWARVQRQTGSGGLSQGARE
jgi:hypothetical protein